MPSKLIEIADAVVLELNTAAAVPDTFSQEFTAERRYVPKVELDDLDLKVLVVPAGKRREQAARGAVHTEFDVEIGIVQRLAQGTTPESGTVADLAEIDALMEFAEEIVDFFEGGDVFASCHLLQPASNDPIWSPEHLQNDKTFLSVVRLTVKQL